MSWLNEAEVKTAEDKQAEFLKSTQQRLATAIQSHMDQKVQERNFDNVISCTTYATSNNTKFKAEGQAVVEWRDEVWVTAYQILDDVEAGTRAIPTEDELIAELPVLVWPV